MHVLVLGGTGPSGLAFIKVALAASHRLTLYARNPSKFPTDLHENSDVTIIKGEFSDLDAVREALQSGAEVLVSFVGPAIPHRGTPITDFYDTLFPLVAKSNTDHGIKRCLILSTASYHAPEDRSSIKWFFGIAAVRLLLGSAYQEINGMSRATTALGEDLEWTLFRVPVLTQGKMAPVQASFLGDGTDGLTLSRDSMAEWVLQELVERKWIRKAPALSNPGWLL